MSDQPAATSGHDAPNAAATTPVTVEQAAAILGVSITTVKRRIRSGALRAEEARRPQGTVWLVYLPPEATAAATSGQGAASVAATTPTSTPAADAMVSLIQTTIGTILGPLVGQLDAQRQTIERQADRVAELERENGRLAAAAERARASEQMVERQAGQIAKQLETIGELRAANRAFLARTEAEPAEPTREPPGSRWRRWAWAAVLIAAIVAVVVVLLFVLPPLEGAL
jgi:hypothetical protein